MWASAQRTAGRAPYSALTQPLISTPILAVHRPNNRVWDRGKAVWDTGKAVWDTGKAVWDTGKAVLTH